MLIAYFGDALQLVTAGAGPAGLLREMRLTHSLHPHFSSVPKRPVQLPPHARHGYYDSFYNPSCGYKCGGLSEMGRWDGMEWGRRGRDGVVGSQANLGRRYSNLYRSSQHDSPSTVYRTGIWTAHHHCHAHLVNLVAFLTAHAVWCAEEGQ